MMIISRPVLCYMNERVGTLVLCAYTFWRCLLKMIRLEILRKANIIYLILLYEGMLFVVQNYVCFMKKSVIHIKFNCFVGIVEFNSEEHQNNESRLKL